MIFKFKKVERNDGSIELRLSFVFSSDEAEAVERIPDDPNVSLNKLRAPGDVYQKSDHILLWLRIICGWVNIWEDKEKNSGYIMKSIQARKRKLGRKKR